jgi:hypothetical protein
VKERILKEQDGRRVDNYPALKTLVVSDYDGRLVDVKMG